MRLTNSYLGSTIYEPFSRIMLIYIRVCIKLVYKPVVSSFFKIVTSDAHQYGVITSNYSTTIVG